MRGTISASVSQSNVTSQVPSAGCNATRFFCAASGFDSLSCLRQVTSISGSAASSPWSTPTKTSPRGNVRQGAAGEKEAGDGRQQQQFAPALKEPPVALNRDHQTHESDVLHQHHRSEQLVQDDEPQLGKSEQHEELPERNHSSHQHEREQQGQLQQLAETHAAEILQITLQHDSAIAELQEKLRASDETVVLLTLRTQRLEGTLSHFVPFQRPSLPSLRSTWNVRRPRLWSRAAGAEPRVVRFHSQIFTVCVSVERGKRAPRCCHQQHAAAVAGLHPSHRRSRFS